MLIIAGTVISCSPKKGDKDEQLIKNLGRKDTLTLYAQYAECGEWGGHQESLRIYRGDDDELWTKYQRDSVVSCDGPIENDRTVLIQRTVKLTEDNQRAIIHYMQDLLDRSLEPEMPSHSGEHFSVRRNDLRLVISRTVHGYTEFDILKSSIIK